MVNSDNFLYVSQDNPINPIARCARTVPGTLAAGESAEFLLFGLILEPFFFGRKEEGAPSG